MQAAKSKYGIGASILRKEDDRHLRGRGEFVGDLRLPGTQHVVFLRSPYAHARICGIATPPAAKGRVFTAADLPRLQPIRIVTAAPGAKSPPSRVRSLKMLSPQESCTSGAPARMPSGASKTASSGS